MAVGGKRRHVRTARDLECAPDRWRPGRCRDGERGRPETENVRYANRETALMFPIVLGEGDHQGSLLVGRAPAGQVKGGMAQKDLLRKAQKAFETMKDA